MLGCEHLADATPDGQDLCARSWAWGLAAAWVTSPVFAFAAFVLMGRLMAAVKAWTEPTILTPKKGLRAGATSAESFRVCTINMCLLPGGFSFAGSWLFDGDDKKSERIDMLLAILDDYDVIMLNEMWGCWWSSYHPDFFERASERGFYVCSSRVRRPSHGAALTLGESPHVVHCAKRQEKGACS